jgi:hypothetical protein
MSRIPPFLFLVACVPALSACASDTVNYPSLARRDIERITVSPEAVPANQVPPAVAAPPSPELTARLTRLVAQAREAHGRFAAHRVRTEQMVGAASGAAVASESWSLAAVALAGLESARSDAMIALADLDQLYAATRIDGDDGTAIAAARDQVIALVGEEDRVLAALSGRFSS